MKFPTLRSLLPFQERTKLSEEVKSGIAMHFSEELPRVIAQQSVKEYYDEAVEFPSGTRVEKGDFKDRGLQDPYRNFIAQIYALMFQADARFDLSYNAYPHGGLSFDTLRNPQGKEAGEVQKAFEATFADRGFRKVARMLAGCIQDQYEQFGRKNKLDMNNPDHQYIDGSMHSIVSALNSISSGDENARLNYVLGMVKIPSKKLN